MHYVKIKDGVIVEGPKELSSDGTFAPNIFWSDSQLEIHGYALVDLSHNEDERIDFDNPVVKGRKVIYPRIRKSPEEILAEQNQRKEDKKKFILSEIKILDADSKAFIKSEMDKDILTV